MHFYPNTQPDFSENGEEADLSRRFDSVSPTPLKSLPPNQILERLLELLVRRFD